MGGKIVLSSSIFWLKAAGVLQLLTAVFHLIGTFSNNVPKNETESQLENLLTTYKFDLGGGFSRTLYEISLSMSLSFTLLCLFAGVLSWYVSLQIEIPPAFQKGMTTIQIVVFTILSGLMIRYTFLPPIICTVLIVICLLTSLARKIDGE